MTEPQIADVLRHTSDNGRYVTDERPVIELAAQGLLYDHGPQALAGGMHYLVLTAAGRAFLNAWQNKHPRPAPTRSQLRYREWLHADSGLRFIEWLRWRYGKK